MALSSASASAFSPITLFESTLTNATMLTETMSQTELLTAHQISSRLQNGIVEALHKLSESLAREVECQRAAAETAQARLVTAQTQVQAAEARATAALAATDSTAAAAAAASGLKSESNVLRKFVSEPQGDRRRPSFGDAVQDFTVKNEVESGDEDCVLLGDSFATDGPPASKRQALGAPLDPRAAVRLSYQQLMGSGPPLFDFNRSLIEGANQQVAASVVGRAKAMCPSNLISDEQWLNYLSSSSSYYPSLNDCSTDCATDAVVVKKNKKDRRLYRRKTKLQRRQKAYTELRSQLNSDEAARFQHILSRDLTSSDEEIDGVEGATRVRQLPWESAVVTSMKQRLDSTFFERFATDKQIATLERCLRDGLAVSSRAPPNNVPAWTRSLGGAGGSAEAAAAGVAAADEDDDEDDDDNHSGAGGLGTAEEEAAGCSIQVPLLPMVEHDPHQ